MRRTFRAPLEPCTADTPMERFRRISDGPEPMVGSAEYLAVIALGGLRKHSCRIPMSGEITHSVTRPIG